MHKKITVVGAGNVGATCALMAAQQELGEVVLIDIVEGMPQGKALDIQQAALPLGADISCKGTNDYADTANSDIVVITAGLARKPGMDRLDLQNKNAEIVAGIVENIMKYSTDTMILVVTNPIDVMTYYAFKKSGLPKNKVFGQAGVLDSSRFAAFIAMELNTSANEVRTMVLGGHGDSMVPLPSFTTVSGIPLKDLVPQDNIDAMVERTRKGGGEIVNLLKTGSAYYAPAASSIQMVSSVLKDTKHILPTSCLLQGEFGLEDLYIGVPAKLGASGVEEIVVPKLSNDEMESLHKSAEVYKKSIAELP